MILSSLLKIAKAPKPCVALVLNIVLLSAMTWGCGKKGPLQPELESLPVAPSETTLRQQGHTLILGWSLPEQNQDGSQAKHLAGFLVRRLVYPAEDTCPTCLEPLETVVDVDIRVPEPVQRFGNRFFWRDTDVLIGFGYRYAITPITIGGYAGTSAYIHRTLSHAPPSPTGLSASPGDRQVTLSWNAPMLPEGSKLLGYNLYRRQGQLFFPLNPLNPSPLTKTTLIDRGLINNSLYEYRISVLVEREGALLESVPTAGHRVKPQAEP